MGRKITLDKAFIFMTGNDHRVVLSQEQPVAELPDDLRPDELDQITKGIKTGAIKEHRGSPKSSETTAVNVEENEIFEFLSQSVNKIKKGLRSYLSKVPADRQITRLIQLLEYEEKGLNPQKYSRKALVDYLKKQVEQCNGIESIRESDQEVVTIQMGVPENEPTDVPVVDSDE
jgi:hypothetical protein